MPEAILDHIPTRRHFLSQAAGAAAAGAAAGGAALTLATVSAPASATAPMAALTSPDADPIFALIEEYRAAAKAAEAAASEVKRREALALEEGLGPYPVVCVVDRRLLKPAPVMVYTLADIDRMVPPDRFSKANAEARTSLEFQIKREKAIFAEVESALEAAQDAEMQALDMLVWTAPTTVAGILALLELWPELRRARIDDDQADAIMISVIYALQEIHPNARAIA